MLLLSDICMPSFIANTLLMGYALISLCAAGCLLIYTHLRRMRLLELQLCRQANATLRERSHTRQLLAQMLPPETIDEVSRTGRTQAKKFKMVTVLFSDIQGFSRITDNINAEQLLDQLDHFYYQFDTVVRKYGIEKIKTIGDAYMCAGGIPHKNLTNPIEVVLVALEIMDQMRQLSKQQPAGAGTWELRMGIDTGPVIAGMVGQTRLTYDIWGSTVNVASRMQSAGQAGRINITENTHLLVRDFFDCEYRGRIPVKNKGDVQMYFVTGIKPHLSIDGAGIYPNEQFFVELQLIRLAELEEFVLEKLERELSPQLYYHNLKHTIDVYNQVELIGRSEGVSRHDMLLLRTAALLHDVGHLVDYDTHEEMSSHFARLHLPRFRYTSEQIERVVELIMATKLPQKPQNTLEMIMCDADLEYLGRTDYHPVSQALYQELHERGRVNSPNEWRQMQIGFIEQHRYFTRTAQRNCNANKAVQLNILKHNNINLND